MTMWLTLKQVGGSTKGRGETCRQIRQDREPTCKQLRHRRQRVTQPIGRRAIGILSILQALTTGDIFLRVRTGFGCLEKNLQPTDGVCEQYTHKYSTHRVAQHDHISSREHAWLKSCKSSGLHIFVSKPIFIHVSCLVLCRAQSGGSTQIPSLTQCNSETCRDPGSCGARAPKPVPAQANETEAQHSGSTNWRTSQTEDTAEKSNRSILTRRSTKS